MNRTMQRLRSVQGLVAVSTLAGCVTAGPDYVAPSALAPSGYSLADPVRADAGQLEASQSFDRGSAPSAAWWHAFQSPALDSVVGLALTGSPTLASAQATLAQARATVTAARGGRYPQVTLDVGAGRGEQDASGQPGLLNNAAVGAAFSLDLDAFGAIRRRIEQAMALAQAQRAQWQASRLTLISSTVLQAIDLASATEQTAAARDIIGADERNLELVRVSQAGGKSAGLDVLTAESQLANDRALLPPLQQQGNAARHALAILVGKTPAEWRAPDFDFTSLTLPKDLPLTLPSEMVRQRPDIQAAEAQLHAASAAIGVAVAQLYPHVSLSATLSTSSVGGGLFENPVSMWRIAADALAPLFSGGTLRAQRDAAIYAYAAQLGTYRQAVLQAFGQVADTLQSLANDGALIDAERKALDAAKATLDLTQQSFEAGQASFLQVIEAQRLYQQARLGYVKAQTQRYLDTLQLFTVLGGAEPDAGRGAEPDAGRGAEPP
jgi:NodT family efflux transporter outer membrane factor (OMF) lipoprotein